MIRKYKSIFFEKNNLLLLIPGQESQVRGVTQIEMALVGC